MSRHLRPITCEEAKQLLPPFLTEELDPSEAERLEAHLEECEACFWQDLPEEAHLYLAGRPRWGDRAWGPERDKELDEELTAMGLLLGRTGGLIVLKHDPLQATSVLLLLFRVGARLREEGRAVTFLLPLRVECLLDRIAAGQAWQCFIVPNAPTFPDFPQVLTALAAPRNGPGPVVITSGSHDAWAGIEGPIAPVVYSFTLNGEGDRLRRELSEEVEHEQAVLREEAIRPAFLVTALLDAYGIPIPLSLLARRLKQSEEAIRTLLVGPARGHLFWVLDEEDRPLPFLCTGGSLIAERLVEKAFPEEAGRLEAYRQLVEAVDPGTPQEGASLLQLFHALTLRGKRRFARTLLEASRATVEALVRTAPPPTLLTWARLYAQVGLLDRADDIFQKALTREPRNVYLRHAFSTFLIERGRYQEAEVRLMRLKEEQPENLYVLHSLAELEKRRGRPEDARRWYEEILKRDPEHIPTFVAYADLRREQGNYEEAGKLLRQALALDPGSVYAWNLLGQVEAEQGHFDEARSCFEEALKRDPRNLQTFHAQSTIARRRGHFQEAKQWLEQAEALNPESPYVLHAWGELAKEQEDFEEARKRFDTLLSLEPTNVPALVAYADLLGKWGDADKGLELLRQVEAIEAQRVRRNPYLDTLWGELEAWQNRFSEAEAHFRQHPGHVPTLAAWAKMEADRGRFEEARRLLQEALRRNPPNVFDRIRTLNTWAGVEAKAGQLDVAQRLVDRALALDPDNAYTLILAAHLLERRGAGEQAEEMRCRAETLGYQVIEKRDASKE